jgi:hypothetical protein
MAVVLNHGTFLNPTHARMRVHTCRFRDDIIEAGGEGVVLHQIAGPYCWQKNSKRTSATIKYAVAELIHSFSLGSCAFFLFR